MEKEPAKKKNPHAVALRKLAGSKPGLARAAALTPAQLSRIGKKAGKVGGPARAAALTPEQRSAIARAGAAKRWEKKRKESDGR